ncbi:hypothetical protein TruAng_008429 [Truncatella angustata]|nr:hypothetical protein TruAng_008429 [Truncatella angustata]
MSNISLCSFDETSPRNAFMREIAFGLKIPAYHIDCNASFIQNGGDSISAIEVVASCRSRDINITVSMIMSSGSIRDLIHVLDYNCKTLNSHPQKIVDPNCYMKGNPAMHLATQSNLFDNAISPPKSQHSQATDAQLSLIYGSNAINGRNIIRYCEAYDTKHIPQVKHAWSVILSAEPIFRTRFEVIEEKYCLVEGEIAPFTWEEETVFDRETYVTAPGQLECGTNFIGVKFKVIHLEQAEEPRESTVIWIIHHALVDGYSSMLLLNKHRKLLGGGKIEPGPSYTQFVGQIAKLQDTWQPGGQDFWIAEEMKLDQARSQLQVASPGTPSNPHYACQTWKLEVSQDDLSSLAKRSGFTVASIFYAAWALTLRRYVDSDHVSFGLILSGRSLPLPNAMSVIGPLINTVPFQVSLDSSQTVHAYISSVFKHWLKLDELQWTLPRDRIDKAFATTLNIQFETPLLEENPLGLVGYPNCYHESAIPLLVEVLCDGHVRILYHEHEFSSKDIERLGTMFAKATRVLTEQHLTVGQCCNELIAEDISQLWQNGNCSSTYTSPGFWHESLVDLFDQTARTHPSVTAIEKGSNKLTFLELSDRVELVARFLTRYVEPGGIVCIHADHSINWVIAIYGILKAGGVYCSLDAALPSHLRAQNFYQSGSGIFLCGGTTEKAYKPDSCGLCFSIDDILLPENNMSPSNTEKLLPKTNPDDGAYLCFTSGSTGVPKGILCSHQNLVAFQKDFDVRLRSRPGWRVGQIMSPAFDGSIHEIFSALSYGSTLVLRSSSDPFAHLATVDATILTPSIARILEPGNFPCLKVLYLVGEAVPQAVCDKWAASVTTYNMYGPTEATCGATIKRLECGKPVTLGNPNPSTRIYVLNSLQELVPPGVIGEIYLAGVQVSLGYLNNAEENAKRFLEDLVHRDSRERKYRTGDRGYWDENGEMRFCGRNDRQVKLRGFRIDLDDIEVRIRDCIPGCTDVAVIHNQGDLLVLLQPKSLELTNTRRLLSLSLPGYAVPRHIAAVQEFPRTNAGKLDYKAIKEFMIPESNLIPHNYNVRLLEIATQVWKEVLGHESMEFHMNSNFFELGGHSLLQIEVANKLSRLLEYSIPLISIIQSPTLGELVERLEHVSTPVKDTSQRYYKIPSVSPIEESWYRKYHFNGGSSSFNVAIYFDLGPDVDTDKLTSAWNYVLGRHNISRCRYQLRSDGTLEKVFLSDSPKVLRADEVDVRIEVNRPFELARGHLIRITLTPHALLIVASHIICDYTSLNTLLRKVGSRYFNPEHDDLTSPIGYINSLTQAHPTDVDFWREYLCDLPKPDYIIGDWRPRLSYSGTSRTCQIPADLFLGLHQFVSSRRMTPHQICLAAVSLALQHHSDTIDLTLGAPHLGRDGTEAQTAIGLFLQPLVIRIRYPPPVSAEADTDFLRVVQKSSQNALAHAIPWDSLLGALSMREELPDTDLFDVMVSYHGGFGGISMPGMDAKPRYTWTEGAKFKLMVEFIVANEEALLMRLEYSDECFNDKDMSLVERLIVGALEMVVQGSSFEAIKRSLSSISIVDEDEVAFEPEDFYGVRLDKF